MLTPPEAAAAVPEELGRALEVIVGMLRLLVTRGAEVDVVVVGRVTTTGGWE